jgi:Putative outer membrane beta-barrel porin, MtrB/PioB
MDARPCFSMLAASLGAALVLLGAGSARADSATGVDTALGNALNPPGQPGVPRALADDYSDTVRRSPTGQLYPMPPDPAEREGVTSDGGYNFAGDLSAGMLFLDQPQKNALFNKYKDLSTGFYLDSFHVQIQKPPGAYYFETSGGGVGHRDQFYGAQFGRYNDWRVKVFYNETQNVFTDSYTSLYNGTGTGHLTLPGGLLPNGGATPVTSGTFNAGAANYVGATSTCSAAAPCWRYTGPDGVARVFSNATALAGINWTGSGAATPQPVSGNSIAGAINTYLGTVPGNTELGLIRRKAGASAEVRLSEAWKGYAGLTAEHRTGARPFSMNENNSTVEIPEPIDYTTVDALAGLSYTDPLMQANLRGSASFFHNAIGALTVDQPWLAAATGLAAAQTTIFDLYPDNEAFNVKGEFARRFPGFLNARLTANVALGTSLQDDPLLMPVDPSQSAQISSAMGSTVIKGINNPGYATNTLDLNNWNGVNGLPLSRATAQQRIDSALANVALALKPTSALDLKGDVRYRGTYNNGGYTAYNPLTGQFGRGFRNSTSFDLVAGSSGAPGAIGVPCYVLPGYATPAGCTFNGNAGVTGQSTNNPANIPVFSPPRDVKQVNYTLSAGYDLGKVGSLNGNVEREDFYRTYRERDKTWEDKFKVGFVTRGLEWLTARLSYEAGWRRGTAYHFWSVNNYGTGLPGLDWNTIVAQYGQSAATAPGWTTAPAALQGYVARYASDSRKFDLADRDQQVLNARVNLLPLPDLDLGVAFQFKDANYPSSGLGLEHDQTTSVDVEAGYQPLTQLQVNASYSWQSTARSMRANSGTNASGAGNTCTFPAGTSLTPDQAVNQCAQQLWVSDANWNLNAKDQNHALVIGVQSDLGVVRLGVDYKLSIGTSSVTYDSGPNVLTTAQATLAGSGFPDMSLIQHSLTAHVLIAVHKRVVVHLFYMLETGEVKDWHYQGLPIGASAAENNATLMLDAGPQNYHTNVFGMLFQFKL